MPKNNKKIERRVNIYDLNHIKTRIDEKTVEFFKNSSKDFKTVKLLSFVKIFLGLIAAGCQGYAYKLTKNHYVIGAMCIVYFILTTILDIIASKITKSTILLSKPIGKKKGGICYRFETSFVEEYSTEMKMKLFLIKNAKGKSIFKRYLDEENMVERVIKVNNFFDTTGLMAEKKFNKVLRQMVSEMDEIRIKKSKE